MPRIGSRGTQVNDPRAYSSLVGLADGIISRENVDPELAERLAVVRDYLVAEEDAERPFLTVLVRTQGKRIETLRDALLCLQSQSDQDFEVIVLDHDSQPDAAAAVRASVAILAPSLRDRVRVLTVSGGSRATPLNVGVLAAQGRYIAVYDDDDILFGHWVEAFHAASAGSHGRLLRANVANQRAQPEAWGTAAGFRTISRAMVEYPPIFDQLSHFLVNYSPFMSWAFPRSLFFTYGVRFDESLTVVEDWDMILQGSMLLGVTDVPALTAIYRRWEGLGNSYSEHSLEAWNDSEQRVIDRINDSVSMMAPGVMRASRAVVAHNIALVNFKFLFNGTQLRFPLNVGWKLAHPPLRFAVRVRNRLRRMAGR